MAGRLDDYVTVAERVSAASAQIQHVHADPPVMLTDVMGYIRVTVTLHGGDSATGTASFRLDLGGKSAQATNPIEDCETSAVGRALAFLGYETKRGIASREEVQEARRREASYQSHESAPAAANPRSGLTTDEARQRFYAKFSSVIHGDTWSAVQKYLDTRHDEPTSAQEWIEAGKRVAAAMQARAAEIAEVPA